MPDISPSPAAEPQRLRRTLIDLSRVVLACDREAACCEGVSASGSHALEALARLGPATLNEVAAELFVDKSTASRVVRSLERDGLVARSPDPEDRRALRLSLTPEGEVILSRIRADALEANRRLLDRYPPEVRRGMVDLLADLVGEAARASGATAATGCAPQPPPAPPALRPGAGERAAVRRLLAEVGLPDTGLDGAFPAGWVLVHEASGRELAATAAVEMHGTEAALRSVAVRHALRGRGMGRRVVDAALAGAAAAGVECVYLLTADAAPFFTALGFAPIARSEVPRAVRESESFAQPRCASAQAMRKTLSE